MVGEFSWTTLLSGNSLILKITGHWPWSTSSKFHRIVSRLYTVVLIGLLLNLPQSLQITQLHFLTDDIQKFLGALCLCIQECQLNVKGYSLIGNFGNLEQLLHFLESEELFQPKTDQQRMLIQRGFQTWKKYFIAINIAALVTCISWTLFPVFDNLTKEHELPLESWFPFDTKVSPYYEISYSYLFIHLWLAAFATHNLDNLMTLLMTYMASQCDLLCYNLETITSDHDRQFRESIQHHKKILRFCEMCTDFLFWPVFIQIATISICTGITLVQLTLVPPFTTEFYHVLAYLLTILLQMYQYSFFGNQVFIKSNKIADAAFRMDFIQAPLNTKKNLVFFMLRTQKPITVPILNLTHLSLETYIKILRTAWSYFTLLQKMEL